MPSILWFVGRSSMLDIAPDYAGIVFGISNTVRRHLLNWFALILNTLILFMLVVRFPTFLASLRPPWSGFSWTTMGTGVSGRLVDSLFLSVVRADTYCENETVLFQAVFWISGLVHIIGSLLFLCKGKTDRNPINSFSSEGSDQIQTWAKLQQPLT